jgi:isoleucyl-tRNA synthetase
VPALAGKRVSTLIWTTTPWTIPSNLALAFHPEFVYGAYPVGDTHVIVAERLAEQVAAATGRTFGPPAARFPGALMERLVFTHPLYHRDSLAVVGDYVTLEQGTGVVHTAPGHGADDFHTGVRYGLDIYAPIGPGGHFLDTVELFGGQRVFDANPKVEDALAQRGRLWHRETYEHSYPHCWRCHNPVIFLATSQWFISMEANGLRGRALQAIDVTRWIPAWGRERIHSMIAFRPDWCISRQRAWGVPIPALTCTACQTPVLTKALTDRAADVFEQYPYGADAWYEGDIAQFIPAGLTCASCGGASFERETNILDVWFDSGSSHEAVLPFYEELRWPADIYLEGSDQHRGWFHSSLLIGIGTRGRAPFDQVLTHGFVVDEQGRKMSSRRAAPTSCASGSPWWTTPKKCGSVARSSHASWRRTGSCATRAAFSWRTSTISIRPATWCRSSEWKKWIGTRWHASPMPRSGWSPRTPITTFPPSSRS